MRDQVSTPIKVFWKNAYYDTEEFNGWVVGWIVNSENETFAIILAESGRFIETHIENVRAV